MSLVAVETLDIASLPSLSHAERKGLPRVPVVYFVFRPEPVEIVYIGQSKCLHDRWLQHDKSSQFTEQDRIAWHIVVDKGERSSLEKKLIQHWKPQYNRRDVQVIPADFRATTVRVRPGLLRRARFYLDEEDKSIQQFLAEQLELYVRQRDQRYDQKTEKAYA